MHSLYNVIGAHYSWKGVKCCGSTVFISCYPERAPFLYNLLLLVAITEHTIMNFPCSPILLPSHSRQFQSSRMRDVKRAKPRLFVCDLKCFWSRGVDLCESVTQYTVIHKLLFVVPCGIKVQEYSPTRCHPRIATCVYSRAWHGQQRNTSRLAGRIEGNAGRSSSERSRTSCLASSIGQWTGHGDTRKSNGGESNVEEFHLEWQIVN